MLIIKENVITVPDDESRADKPWMNRSAETGANCQYDRNVEPRKGEWRDREISLEHG
jgi:hypothetical protein